MPEPAFRISVVVPTLRRPAAVARFIDSLNCQTLMPLELVIVDAGAVSTEAEYRARLHPSIELCYLRARAGAAHQRNVGIEAVSGDFVGIFDDDVTLSPDFLAQAVAPFH